MSLRTALATLPDDRGTARAVHEVISFLSAHQGDVLGGERIARATGLSHDRVELVLRSLCVAGVLHCDGDPRPTSVSFDPDRVLELEVERFLRIAVKPDARLQASVGKFRNRLG
jgi:hypothetical protein